MQGGSFMEPSSRPLAHPGSLEEAVRQVILDNTRMGYTCQRLVVETENGQASNLRVACSRVISSPVGLQETEEALGGLPQLLTIEDFVSHWGAEWGFDETDVQLAQEGAEYYDAVAGFTRFFAAEGAASTPAAGPSHSPSETGARIKLAPSILSADIARLGEQVAEAVEAGADYIHVDVMDGHYVPNLTFGPLVVEALRPLTQLPLDVHLMVEEPDRIIPEFARAGASIITVHPEACRHLHRTIQNVKEAGCRVGVALNPGTSLNAVEEVLADLDLALVMTVNPGFGGQKFIESVLGKVERLRGILDDNGYTAELEVDGGINAETAPRIVAAGARVLVAGSAVFNRRESVTAALGRIRQSIGW
jgi:ribulose-phosphate 3-epimerase